MPFWRFSVLSFLGSIPWVLALAFAGHALGSDWTTVRKGFQYVDYLILLLILAGIAYAIVRRRGGARRRTGLPDEGTEAGTGSAMGDTSTAGGGPAAMGAGPAAAEAAAGSSSNAATDAS
jgi:hypothetical protein